LWRSFEIPYTHTANGHPRSIVLWIRLVRLCKRFKGPRQRQHPPQAHAKLVGARLQLHPPSLPDGLDTFTFFINDLFKNGILTF